MFESHFQSFDDHGSREHSRGRLKALRAELAQLDLDGFVVPRADRHQNEYVPPSEERLAWLTGFSGSAGLAIVLKDKAAIFVDGRYTLAVRDQVDVSAVTPVALADQSPEAWISAHIRPGQKLGYDAWLATPSQVARLEKAVKAADGELVALGTNPIDLIWRDRPPAPRGRISLRNARLAGETAARKIARAAKAAGKADALFISDPHSLAWTFNIRGADVSHTPLPLGFALIPKAGRPTLFVDVKKLTAPALTALSKIAVTASEDSVETVLTTWGKAGKTVLFDPATIPARLTQALTAAGGQAELGPEPLALMKAKKNAAELMGTRQAHLRDGIAVTRFLHWFALNARPGRLDEITAAEALEHFRRETGALKDVSFPSISAAGPNSAIPHYRVTSATNRKLRKGIFLIDSGGQYEDGTTDITRTLAVGQPSAEMRDRFTRVLKGHIAIARAVFPEGTSGAQIDAFARAPLWAAGLDFDHGTGHGVGVYLSVHEGPQRISKAGHTVLEAGMILSNEPGYYKASHWGIRIENLVIVERRNIPRAERKMFGFETITLAPIDLRLIDHKLLDGPERAWLNAYHARVRREIGPHLNPAERSWLRKTTGPI